MTPHWTPDDPGAGSFDGIATRRARLGAQREHATQMHQVMARAAAECPSFWCGAGSANWAARASENAARWQRLSSWASADSAALDRYSADVEAIAFAAARQKVILVDAAHDLTRAALAPGVSASADALLGVAPPPVDPVVDDATRAAASANRVIAGLAAERKAADARAVSRGQDARDDFHGLRPPAMPAGLTAEGLATLSPLQALILLTTLTPRDLAALAAADPTLAARLQEADPALVAVWWRGLTASEKDSLARNGAVFIGNLEGVDYTHRDVANRAVLEAETDLLVGERENLVDRSAWLERTLGPKAGESAEWLAIQRRLAALDSEERALNEVAKVVNAATSSTPRQLISLRDLSTHPKVAVSVGNLDTADHITYVVPGMGTTVAGSLNAYVGGASNLARAQRAVLDAKGNTDSLATVAWLGYDAPGANDVSGVLGDQLARAGGLRLAQSLKSLKAARNWSDESQQLSVVGHSYGSTTAALALTETGVGAFVMLGSAGITNDVYGPGALKVPAGDVFASQGFRDGWAPIGQAFGFRQDPRQVSFGARQFSSEVSGEGEDLLEGITAHGPLVNGDDGTRYSYLDEDTTAIRNTALVTLGYGDEASR